MRNLFAALIRLSGIGLLILLLVSCADLAAALPPRPTPFPTLARLPSVTPVTPSPLPTATSTVSPISLNPTPTVTAIQAVVTITANVRSGPDTTFDVLTIVEAGAPVSITGRSGDWYRIRTAEGDSGWLFGQLLDVPAESLGTIPTIDP